ncbi:hypothetical protein BSFA1_42320 [Burkholderia sp. SFA1]|nr:hypothetical protein BSFA1_42320 [Burkholderia sp. SFA1]
MNCKSGDLAYIVGGDTNPSSNLGRIVEVVRLEGTYADIGPVWVARSRHLLKTVHGFKDEFHTADAWLRPISGFPLDEETPAEINLPEAFKLALGIEMRAWA